MPHYPLSNIEIQMYSRNNLLKVMKHGTYAVNFKKHRSTETP